MLYLRHPLAVMEELARLRCKTSVLAAAVLHDTMEDCAVTYEYLREHFSYEVAEIVLRCHSHQGGGKGERGAGNEWRP